MTKEPSDEEIASVVASLGAMTCPDTHHGVVSVLDGMAYWIPLDTKLTTDTKRCCGECKYFDPWSPTDGKCIEPIHWDKFGKDHAYPIDAVCDRFEPERDSSATTA